MAAIVSDGLNNDPETLLGRLHAYMPLYGHGETSADEAVLILLYLS